VSSGLNKSGMNQSGLNKGLNQALNKEELRIRLLVVDDEQSIRKLCVTVGEALGFICMEAESGDSALALLEEQPAHMVLTDMVMPLMSGSNFWRK
jgi:CheY-like chemotaxis protein